MWTYERVVKEQHPTLWNISRTYEMHLAASLTRTFAQITTTPQLTLLDIFTYTNRDYSYLMDKLLTHEMNIKYFCFRNHHHIHSDLSAVCGEDLSVC